jgi:HAD superfamily hydrolase (TIGR01509 family)
MNKSDISRELKTKKSFIFDMDGTIVNLEDLNRKGYKDTIRKFFDIGLSDEEYQKYFSGTRTAKAFNGYLQSVNISDYDVDELIADFRERKRHNLVNATNDVVSLMEGVIEYLSFLKDKGMEICLATSTVPEFVDIILSHFELKQYFNEILTADDVTEGKPSPQIYNRALEKMNSKIEDSVVFEDSKNGIASGKASGVLTIGILTEGLNDGFVYNSDYVVKDYLEVLELHK